ncbi:MAG TPA: hypothetical protein VL282_17560 [Tepidisphaeraceae bacterium]|jgi:hypothetical protein|nr:hypothetical protein [Tepidisphaeraceae bacterium]
MSSIDSLGLGSPDFSRPDNDRVEHVVRHRVLHRVLEFTGRSIDDVVNHPIVKNEVLGYYKLHRWVERGMEIHDLERQWNA